MRPGGTGPGAWFSRFDLDQSTDAQRRVVGLLVDVLDELAPDHLDCTRQRVEHRRGGTWLVLQHETEDWLVIEVHLGDSGAQVHGVLGHDEVYPDRADPTGRWESELVELVTGLLRSEYSRTVLSIGGRPVREVVDITGSHPVRVHRALSWRGRFPLLGRGRQRSSRAGFGCRS